MLVNYIKNGFKCLGYILLWLLGFYAFAQWDLTHISADAGLSQHTVKTIIQDNKGFIWVGTYYGINRYDGYTFKQINYLSEPYGLSSNIIGKLLQDKNGFIWAATIDGGLNRINPETGEINVLFNSEKVLNDYGEITDMYQFPSGEFLLDTNKGLILFSVTKNGTLQYETFINELHGTNLANVTVLPSAYNRYWILTHNNMGAKLHEINVVKNENALGLKLTPTKLTDFGLKGGYPVDYIEYPKNTLWFISDNLQLLKVQCNDELNIIDRQVIDLAAMTTVSKSEKLKLAKDKGNGLWVAGYGNLLKYDIVTGKVTNLRELNALKDELGNRDIEDILIDKANVLWIGTLNKGLYKIDLENHTFYNFIDFLKGEQKAIVQKYPVQALSEDDTGNIWIGLQNNGGLAMLNRAELTTTLQNNNAGSNTLNPLNLSHNNQADTNQNFDVKRISQGRNGWVWVGAKSGLSRCKFNKDSKSFTTVHFKDLKSTNGKLINRPVFAVEEDSQGHVWVGYWNAGVLKMTLNHKGEIIETINFTTKTDDSLSLSNNYVRDILEDKNGNIWVGTIQGLNKLVYANQGNTAFTHYLNDPKDQNSLSNNYVLDIFQAKNGKIYVGTFGGGLNAIEVMDNQQLKFTHYKEANGLSSNVVYQIKEDFQGNIWLMHINEISKLEPATGKINTFEKKDGFRVNEFKENAMVFTQHGKLLCGGENGFTFFEPNNLSVNTFKPEIEITEFKLFNTPVLPFQKFDNKTILTKSIAETQHINLPYTLNAVEFTFSSLHYSNPSKNQYKYMLEGYDKDWQYSNGNNRRFASYTNLSPGDYTFKVFGSNSSGVWSQQAKTISITITPPWYLTAWALAAFSVLVLLIIIGLVKFRLHQIHLKNKLNLENAIHEKSEEMNQMKLQFFTNISHELRTPLTLIMGPLQQLMNGNVNAKDVGKLNAIMYKNSNRLLKLINQLLDFRKAESGRLNLIVQQGELVGFIADIYQAFEEIALEKNIRFQYTPEDAEIFGFYDNDKVEKILYNLLSNAFKFTPKGKHITIGLSKKNENDIAYAEIKVTDNGIGIPEKDLESIFERFYQTKNEHEVYAAGSGLGLAYVKHLVEVHKGEINIQSKLHEGTTCTFLFPISKAVYQDSSIIEEQPKTYEFNYTKVGVEVIKERMAVPKPSNQNSVRPNHGAPVLLIVEDNPDLLEYMENYFSAYYHVITANNGKEGLELAHNKAPNFIVSDLMMPIMDGIEMCKAIKTDVATSHIPVIILTAKAGLENEKEGLETGADEFVLKPFSIEILKLRIDNILRTKAQWVQKFKDNPNAASWKDLSNKLDQKFMKQAIQTVKDNIDDPLYSVETFAVEMGLSRSALFKKIKSITGQSTSEFIRTIRLTKAAKLITSGKYSITEVIYMVGFSDPKYFRTCFKKQFGTTPSSYFTNFKELSQ